MRLAMNQTWAMSCRAVLLGAALLAMIATPAQAQLDLSKLGGNLGGGAAIEPVTVQAEILAADGDQPPRLAVTADIADGFHIYSITQPKVTPGPIPSEIRITPSPNFKLGEFNSSVQADAKPEPAFDNLTVESHHGRITWTAPIKLAAGTDLAALNIPGKLYFQACDARSCQAPNNVRFTAVLASGAATPRTPDPAAPPVVDAAPTREIVNTSDKTMAVSAVFSAGKDGQPAMLYVTADLAPAWHTFSVTQADDGPNRTTIKLIEQPDVRLLGAFEPIVPAEIENDPTIFPGVDIEVHHGQVTWRAPIELPADADLANLTIAGNVKAQRCQEQNCLPPKNYRFTAVLADEPTIAALAGPSTAQGESSGTGTYKTVIKTPLSMFKIVQFLGMALVGGLILNFMPCVLPVIGLKIMGFVQQSGDDRRRILNLNLWFTAGLISVFMVLATLAVGFGLGWGEQFTSIWFNIALASLVFVMALSFLGVWEIPIPGFVGTGKANELTLREGAQGAFFKGVITTLLATPCSGPLLGPVFGFTLGQSAWLVYAIFFCVGLGMASPYLAIGAFPSLIRYLPRPGVWMDTFKHAMGFVMLGAVVFLLMSVGEKYLLAVVGFLFGLWAAFWWIGRTPLTAPMHSKVRAWMGGAIIAGVVAITSFNLLISGEELLPWQPYSDSKLVQLTGEKKTVLVEFTADWCLTCKVNLKYAINRSAVADLVKKHDVVTLKADWTDGSEEIKTMLARLGSNSIPILAVFPADKPNEPIILPDLITQGQVLEALKQAGPSQKNPIQTTAMAR